MNHRNLHFSKSFSRSSCRQFDIQYCTDIEKEVVDNLEDFEAFDDEIAEVDREQQVSEFVETPSFVTLFTGSQVEPLYFVQVAEKGAAESILLVITVMLSYQERDILEGTTSNFFSLEMSL